MTAEKPFFSCLHGSYVVLTALQSLSNPYRLTAPAKSDTSSMTCEVALMQG